MRLNAAMAAVGMLAASASAWKVKSNGTTNSSSSACDPIGALCSGSDCCGGLACSPVLNVKTLLLEARCVVTSASSFDGKICYNHGDKCFYNQQCCSGACNTTEDGSGVYMCNGDAPPTTSSSTSTTSSTWAPGDDDVWGDVERVENGHWGDLSFHIPVGALIVICAVAFAFAILVMPRVQREREERVALGVDKLPPTPPPAGQPWASGYQSGRQSQLHCSPPPPPPLHSAHQAPRYEDMEDQESPFMALHDHFEELGYVELESVGKLSPGRTV
eukprot:m.68413 g.68413  ORF g.68413 m.68413 type:complete len:274 (+) comp8508_c0_seq1:58-879(+)